MTSTLSNYRNPIFAGMLSTHELSDTNIETFRKTSYGAPNDTWMKIAIMWTRDTSSTFLQAREHLNGCNWIALKWVQCGKEGWAQNLVSTKLFYILHILSSPNTVSKSDKSRNPVELLRRAREVAVKFLPTCGWFVGFSPLRSIDYVVITDVGEWSKRAFGMALKRKGLWCNILGICLSPRLDFKATYSPHRIF